MWKKLACLGLSGWLLLSSLVPVAFAEATAEEIASKKAELSQVKEQVAQMEAQRDRARAAAEAASGNLRVVTRELRGLQRETNTLRDRQHNLETQIANNQAELNKKEQEFAWRLENYKKRLRDIYMAGQLNYLDVLFGAKDFGDFASRMYLLQKIISNDIRMITEIQQLSASIREQQQVLAAEVKEIDETREKLKDREAQVSKLRDERSEILYKAQERQQQTEAEYDKLLTYSENIASMLRQMEHGGALETNQVTSGYVWPCRGVITSYFGWRTHPIFGTTRYHSGMDIAVDTGTPIHAINSGRVIYSAWMGGYGYCVMIDHGGGIVSLYGHNSALNVSEGQYVNRNDVIAFAGSTGYSTGPHCHLEVRLHGEVTEPLNYLPPE